MKTKLVPIAELFRIKKINSEQCRKLYGYTDSSYYSEYSYKREGFLEKNTIKYIKPEKSEIIVKKKHSKKLKKFLKENKIPFLNRQIILTKTEARKLKLPSPGKWKTLYEELKGSEDFMITIDI